MERVSRYLAAISFLVIAAVFAGCGGGNPSIGVSISPSSEGIDIGQSVAIAATVTNDASNSGVTWTCSGAACPGSAPTSASFTFTPTATGTAQFTAASVKLPSASNSTTITVNALPSITTTSLPGGTVGTAYSGGSIAATGGTSPLSYSVSAGSLPAGLSLNSSSGAITGTPSGPASTTPVSFTVKVTDSSAAAAQSATKALSITVSQAAAITSANKASFVVSTNGTFNVTATGVPTPTLSESGALPSGVTFTDNGNGTGTLSGTPAAGTANNYAITFTANNGVGTAATQSFTLTVGQAPAITSASSTSFTAGTAGTFSITTSGFPAPSLTESGALPSGVTFTDNGNGTAKFSGTPAAGSGQKYTLTISASNGVGSNASQNFTLTVDETPAITSANKATFTVLSAGTFQVTTSGYPTPSITESGALPTGVTFVDNGNGTGTLAGTPATGTAGSYPITFTPSNGVGSPVVQNFTLTVGQAPTITSGNSTTFTVGTAGTFSVTTSGFPKPNLTESGALPNGVTFTDNGNGMATLAGTAAATTGGTYPITITASNGVGSNATQNFTLTVDEAPSITSSNSTNFSVGGAGTFTVNATGFPNPSITESGALPSGVTFTPGTGSATLSGTPASGTSGTYPITFTASNGVGSNATQSFTLTVDTAPVFTSANTATFTVGVSGTTFTVTTTGTPTATLSISAGTLPNNLTFTDNGNGTATLAGTPATGTGKAYPITFKAINSSGSTTQNFTLTVDEAPKITSAASATFTESAFMSFSVTTSGFPAPAITEAGSLPSGVSLTDNGNGTATLSGTPASGTSGSYPITITANNGVSPNGTQSFTLTVNAAPVFTSSTSTTFTVNTPGTFTVSASGNPTPSISTTSTLPSGVTLTDNGNGTATLSGTPGTGTGGVYNISIKATSTSGTTTQNFTLTVDEAPGFSSNNAATFFLNTNNTFTVQTTGYPQNTMTIIEAGPLPSGVQFVDNGNGTGTLSGTPTTTTGSPWTITFTASNGIGTPANQTFTLTISSDPCASFSSGSESLLNGSYAFLLKGFDDGTFSGENGQQEPALVGGVLMFNGSTTTPSITAGKLDLNLNGTAGLDSLNVSSGTYKVGSDHRACMALNLSDGTTEHYAVSLANISSGVASTGHMISFDAPSGTGTVYATGTLKKQSSTIPTTLSGNFAFVIASTQNIASGGDAFGAAGIIKLSSNGTVTGGEADSNEGGAIDKNCGTFTDWQAKPCYSILSGGTYSIASNGRGSISFTVSAGGKSNPVSYEMYVVSSTDFLIMSNVDQTANVLSGGEALQQSGSFSNSSLNGKAVFYQSGFDCSSGANNNCTIDQSNPNGTAGSNTVIALFSGNGSGGGSGTFYDNSSGSIQTGSLSGATYTIDSNGRGIFTLPSTAGCSSQCTLLMYFAGTNRAWELGSDAGVGSGGLEPQSATSGSGTYAFGGINPAIPSGVAEGVATFTSGTPGTVTGTQDQNNPQASPQAGGTINANYSVDSTGFGEIPNSGTSCSPSAGTCQFMFYVVSPTRVIGMDSSGIPSIQPADQ
jgi:hypothetical protein